MAAHVVKEAATQSLTGYILYSQSIAPAVGKVNEDFICGQQGVDLPLKCESSKELEHFSFLSISEGKEAGI